MTTHELTTLVKTRPTFGSDQSLQQVRAEWTRGLLQRAGAKCSTRAQAP